MMFFIEPLWVRIAIYISLFLYLAIAIIYLLMKRVRGCPHPRCPRCAYDLTTLTRHDCPECGFDFARRGIHPPGKPSRRVWLLVAGIWTSVACWPTACSIDYSVKHSGIYSVHDTLELHIARDHSRGTTLVMEVQFIATGQGLVFPWSPIEVPRHEVAMGFSGPADHRGYAAVTVNASDLRLTASSVADLAKDGLMSDRFDEEAMQKLIDSKVKVIVNRGDIEAIRICLDEIRRPDLMRGKPGTYRAGRLSANGAIDYKVIRREMNGNYVHYHGLGFTHKVSGVWWAWIPATVMMMVIWLVGLWTITRLWRRWSRRTWMPEAVTLPS